MVSFIVVTAKQSQKQLTNKVKLQNVVIKNHTHFICPIVSLEDFDHGNNFCFRSSLVGDGQSVLLICVPNFDLTHSCVLVNLNSCDCREIKFGTSLEATPNLALERQREIEREVEGGSQLLSSQQPQEEMSLLHHMDQDENLED